MFIVDVPVGTVLKMKSREWYETLCEEQKTKRPKVSVRERPFEMAPSMLEERLEWLGKEMTVTQSDKDYFKMREGSSNLIWFPEFFEFDNSVSVVETGNFIKITENGYSSIIPKESALEIAFQIVSLMCK